MLNKAAKRATERISESDSSCNVLCSSFAKQKLNNTILHMKLLNSKTNISSDLLAQLKIAKESLLGFDQMAEKIFQKQKVHRRYI